MDWFKKVVALQIVENTNQIIQNHFGIWRRLQEKSNLIHYSEGSKNKTIVIGLFSIGLSIWFYFFDVLIYLMSYNSRIIRNKLFHVYCNHKKANEQITSFWSASSIDWQTSKENKTSNGKPYQRLLALMQSDEAVDFSGASWTRVELPEMPEQYTVTRIREVFSITKDSLTGTIDEPVIIEKHINFIDTVQSVLGCCMHAKKGGGNGFIRCVPIFTTTLSK